MTRRGVLLGAALSALIGRAYGEDGALADILALVELVAGRMPDPVACRAIADAAVAARIRDAEGQARAGREIAAFLVRLREADPVERAWLRIHARVTLWFGWDNPDGGAARRAAFRLDPVIAADPRSRLLVTEDELAALLTANRRAGEIAGVAPPPVDQAALSAELTRAFPSWPASRQRGFAHASLRRAILDRAWRSAAAAERDAAVRQSRRLVRGPRDVPRLARALEVAAAAGKPLSDLGGVAFPGAPRVGEQLGIISGMSGALRSFDP